MKENRLLILNTFAFLGGLFCFLMDFTIVGILFLLSSSIMLPLYLMQSFPLKSEEDLEVDSMEQSKLQNLEKDYTICMEKLEECQRQSSYFQQNSLLPFFAKPEASPYDLMFSIHSIMKEFKNRADNKDFSYEIACEDSSFPITINSKCMDLILLNLLDNSIKYVPSGGKINITLSHVEEHILIIIKDNGLGCVTDDTTTLFDLNVQESNKISGSGLGLAQVKSAVLACNGQIWCKTSDKKGFAVYIQFLESEEISNEEKK